MSKPARAQKVTAAGSYDNEAAEAVNTRGEPDLSPRRRVKNIVFHGVKDVYAPGYEERIYEAGDGVVVVQDGEIVCVGVDCEHAAGLGVEIIDLKGGTIAPGLVTVGSYLGMMEIRQEKSTADGVSARIWENAADAHSRLMILFLAHPTLSMALLFALSMVHNLAARMSCE